MRNGQFDALIREGEASVLRWPDVGPLWHLLGLGYLSAASPDKAVPPLTKATRLMPKDADVREHLGLALMQSGRLDEAYACLERGLSLAKNPLGLLVTLAHLGNQLGKHAAAERHCERALRLQPGLPEALFNLAVAQRGLGRKAEALATFREVLARSAGNAEAHNDAGLQLLALDAVVEAEAAFRQAIAWQPRDAKAYSNLGRALETQGRWQEALAAFRQALAVQPGMAAVHANLGSLCNALRQFDAAEAACREALRLDPALAVGFTNLGNALVGQKRLGEAEAAFRQALALSPADVDALTNLGNLYQEGKRFEEAVAVYRQIRGDGAYALAQAFHCAAHLCDWSRREADIAELKSLLADDATAIWPFGLLSIEGRGSAAMQKRAANRLAANQFRAQLAAPPLVSPRHHPARDRLRIGYLSADFHTHATMQLVGAVLAAHDRRRFSVHLYSYGPDAGDAGRAQALRAAEVFRDCGALADVAVAQQIVDDGIDLLIDLKGYTQDTRLGISALRPAPVLVSWLGYPGTLGHERLADYIIGDPVVTPPADAGDFSETLALMPHSYQPNDRGREIGPTPSREAAGLPAQGIVFCSFNQSFKFNPDTLTAWSRILQAVPGSVLWLLQPPSAAVANLRAFFAQQGVASERLIVADFKTLSEHLGRLQLADIALDTFPVGSHTTGSDALWVGVPMVTRLGETFASRVAASLLGAVGLPELVTTTWDAYVEKAVTLARDRDRLIALRAQLVATRMSVPLFDTERFARDLERLYEAIWAQHGEGRREIVTIPPA